MTVECTSGPCANCERPYNDLDGDKLCPDCASFSRNELKRIEAEMENERIDSTEDQRMEEKYGW